jgi:hypothetical protein
MYNFPLPGIERKDANAIDRRAAGDYKGAGRALLRD